MNQDHSARLITLNRHYGGSDSTAPSFNRPAYVRGASLQDPIRLPQIPLDGVTISGLIGAESGTQTLYIHFRTTQPTTIFLSLEGQGPRIDQYVGVALRSQELGSLALRPPEGASPPQLPGGDYYAIVSSSQWRSLPFALNVKAREVIDLSALFGIAVDLEASPGQALSTVMDAGVELSVALGRVYFIGEDIQISYTASGYWVEGYAVDDGLALENPQVLEAEVSLSGELTRLSPT
jgi:hypothetical protein